MHKGTSKNSKTSTTKKALTRQAFSHLFETVISVMPCASRKTRWTLKIITHITRPLMDRKTKNLRTQKVLRFFYFMQADTARA